MNRQLYITYDNLTLIVADRAYTSHADTEIRRLLCNLLEYCLRHGLLRIDCEDDYDYSQC